MGRLAGNGDGHQPGVPEQLFAHETVCALARERSGFIFVFQPAWKGRCDLRSIGYSLAEHALMEGASVTLIARNVDKLQQAKASLIHDLHCLPAAVHVLFVDVSEAAAITAAIRDAQERMPIDVLVCNAGVIFTGALIKRSFYGGLEIADTVRVSILGSVFPIRSALPLMKTRSSPTTPQSLVSSVAGLYQ